MKKIHSGSKKQPLLLFDLDGTTIDTNMNAVGTAKYEESYQLIKEFTNNSSPNLEKFKDFYVRFNDKAKELSMNDASRFFDERLAEEYGIKVDTDEFIGARAKKREESYREIVKFIGNDNYNNGDWLKKIKNEFKVNIYIVTTVSKKIIEDMKQNNNLKIDNKSIEDFFEKKIITKEDVSLLKPNPEAYNKVLAIENPARNSLGYSAIAFEDSISGIKSAKAARYNNGKLFVVGVMSSLSSKKLKENGVDYVAQVLYKIKLPELIKKAGF